MPNIIDINSGIYAITNTVNGKQYIGSAVNIKSRWRVHVHHLKNGTHHSIKLQRSWIKHGQSSFCFSIIEYVEDRNLLIEREQFFLDLKKCAINGYNIAKFAGSTSGRILSTEQKKHLSSLATGRKHSEETKKIMSEKLRLRKGEKRSDSTKEKISAKAKGRIPSAEARAKMSSAHKNIKRSPEHAAKIAAANRSRSGMKASEESKIKMSDSAKKRVLLSRRGENGAFINAFGADKGVVFSDVVAD